MICCFLLLLTLTSCVCAPTFAVKVTQSSYQAEENHNITLEWTFTTNTQGPSDLLSIYCDLTTDDHNEPKVLYHLFEAVEVSEIQDDQFSGRVQCDRDVLREGRVRLHVSRLRTEDSGLYWCEVLTGYGSGSDECGLKVTAAVGGPGPERPEPETQEPESRRKINLTVGLTVTVSLVLFLLYEIIQRHLMKNNRGNICTAVKTSSLSKIQSIKSKKTPETSTPSSTTMEDRVMAPNVGNNDKGQDEDEEEALTGRHQRRLRRLR